MGIFYFDIYYYLLTLFAKRDRILMYMIFKGSFQEAIKVTINKKISILMAGAVLSSCAGCSKTQKVESLPLTLLDTNLAPQDVELKWQKDYEALLNSFKNSEQYSESSMFDLTDITDDGTPELIISPSDDVSSQCIIYSMMGTVTENIANFGSYGQFDYLPEAGAIGYSYKGDGFVVGEYQTLQEGFFQQAVSFYNNSESASSGAVIKYQINTDDVTLAKYEEALQPYKEATAFVTGRKYTFGDDAIKYAIYYSESWGSVLRDEQKQAFRDRLSAVLENADLKDAAFEIVDLDLNGLPEMVVSTGILTDSQVRIFYFDTNDVKEIDCSCDTDGSIHYDMTSKVFYATDFYGEMKCWSMAGTDVSSFTPSESSMKCGRKHLLTKESIEKAFM